MRKPIYLTLALLLILCLPLYADFAKLGTSGAQFLKISVGRGSAMGEAFVAVADDGSATFWNPAGLGLLTAREVNFHHNEWIADIRHEYLSVILPLQDFGTMGISLTVLTMGEFEYTDVDDPNTSIREDTGTGIMFNAASYCLGFSFGRMFTDRLAAGVSLKAIGEMVWDMSSTGIAADFGIHYNTGWQGLRLAAAISNFGSELSYHGRQLDFPYDPYPDSPSGYDDIPSSKKSTLYKFYQENQNEKSGNLTAGSGDIPCSDIPGHRTARSRRKRLSHGSRRPAGAQSASGYASCHGAGLA